MACCDEVSSLQPATLCALLATRPVAPLVGLVFNAFDPVSCTINTVTLPTFVETAWVGVEGVAIDITPGGIAGHGPTIGVRVSADAFNNVILGSDGGLYVAPTAPSPQTPITPVDTCSINLSVGGLDNHTLQADVNLSAANNPFCADQNQGTPIYCSPTGLRAMPGVGCNIAGRATAGTPNLAVGLNVPVDSSINVIIVNPSTCRFSRFMAGGEYGFSAASNPGCQAANQVFLTAGGGPLVGPFQISQYNPTPNGPVAGFQFQSQGGTDDVGNIAPGGAIAYAIVSRTIITGPVEPGWGGATLSSNVALSAITVNA